MKETKSTDLTAEDARPPIPVSIAPVEVSGPGQMFPHLPPVERAERIARMIVETAKGMGAEHVVVMLAFPPDERGSAIVTAQNAGPSALAIRGLLEEGSERTVRLLKGEA